MEILNFFKDVLIQMGQIFGVIGDVVFFIVLIGATILISVVVALVVSPALIALSQRLNILVDKFSNKYPKVTIGKVLASVATILAVLYVIPFYPNGNSVSVTELLYIDLKNVLAFSGIIVSGEIEFIKTLLAIFGVFFVLMAPFAIIEKFSKNKVSESN